MGVYANAAADIKMPWLLVDLVWSVIDGFTFAGKFFLLKIVNAREFQIYLTQSSLIFRMF